MLKMTGHVLWLADISTKNIFVEIKKVLAKQTMLLYNKAVPGERWRSQVLKAGSRKSKAESRKPKAENRKLKAE